MDSKTLEILLSGQVPHSAAPPIFSTVYGIPACVRRIPAHKATGNFTTVSYYMVSL